MSVLSRIAGSLCIFAGVTISSHRVLAAGQMNITSPDTTLFEHSEMRITASVSGFVEGEIVRVKGAFFRSQSTNYFGYTKDGDVWVKNSAGNSQQRSVQIGSWDGNLIVRPDYADSGYTGEGEYLLRVRYYFGESATGWSENELPVFIHAPDPTNTPSPTPVPTHTPMPTRVPDQISDTLPAATSFPVATSATKAVRATPVLAGIRRASNSGDSDILFYAPSDSASVAGATDPADVESDGRGRVRQISAWIFAAGAVCTMASVLGALMTNRKQRMRTEE